MFSACLAFFVHVIGFVAMEYNTLEDFGYRFRNGVLRNIDNDSKFVFAVHQSKTENQRRYEKLGEIIDEYMFNLLEEETKLLRVLIPMERLPDEPTSFIFHSKDAMSCKKLLVLVHGSGVVKAGQWSRRLIINDSLESGSQLPYVRKAKQLGFGVLVTNTNFIMDKVTRKRIRGSGSPQEHFDYVLENFVQKSSASHVAIVAHSYGGVVAMDALAQNPDMMGRVVAVALTDSVHGLLRNGLRNRKAWIRENVRNWVSSDRALDTRLHSADGDCDRVSAGTTIHEETSWKAFHSVWRFITDRSNDEDDAEMMSQEL